MKVQAKQTDGTVVLDAAYSSQSERRQAMSNAISLVKSTGGKIRYSTDGDNTIWTTFNVNPGKDIAVQDNSIDW